MATIKVQQIKSKIGYPSDQKRTLAGSWTPQDLSDC